MFICAVAMFLCSIPFYGWLRNIPLCGPDTHPLMGIWVTPTFLTIVNKAKNIGVLDSDLFLAFSYFGYTARNGIAGSYGNSV